MQTDSRNFGPGRAPLANVVAGVVALFGIACRTGEPPAPAPEPKPAPAPAPAPVPPPSPVAEPAAAATGAAPDSGAADAKLGLVERVNALMAQRREERRLAAELAAQEEARLLKYDKGKLPKHTALLAFIRKTRKALDDVAAGAKGAPDAAAKIEKLRAAQRKGIEAQGKVVHSIDPKGGNSNIVTDHDVALNALANDYPAALAASLSGDEKPLAEVRAELDRREKKVESWLEKAKAAKK